MISVTAVIAVVFIAAFSKIFLFKQYVFSPREKENVVSDWIEQKEIDSRKSNSIVLVRLIMR
jgi:hypothetical protein